MATPSVSLSIEQKNKRQEAAVVARLNPSIGIEGALVSRAHGLGLEQLAAVIVAPAGQVVELEILRDRTQYAGVEKFDAA